MIKEIKDFETLKEGKKEVVRVLDFGIAQNSVIVQIKEDGKENN